MNAQIPMGRLTLSSAAVLVALALSACGQSVDDAEAEESSFPLNGDDLGILMKSGGEIALRPGDVNQVEVTRWFTGSPDQAAWEISDDELTLATDCGFLESCDVRYEVVVPDAVAVSLSAANADVTAADFDASVTIETENGDISVENMAADLGLQSTSGNQHATGLSGQKVGVQAENGDVDMAFADAPSTLTVTTDNGSVNASLPNVGYAVSLRTGSGSATNSLIEEGESQRSINVTTESGDITLG